MLRPVRIGKRGSNRSRLIPTKSSYRPDEVAAILGVSRRTIFRWIRDKTIEACRMKGTLRIPQTAMVSRLKERESQVVHEAH
jgi:excisionase family DNA binding protein